MAVYRQVQTTYWQDSFVLTLTPEEKYFYLYLLTNSKTKQCGIYELPLQVIIMETGYNRETVIRLLQKFIEYDKIAVDRETHEIGMKNWLKYNPIQNNPKIQACVEKELKIVKNRSLVGFVGYPIEGVSQEEEEQEEEEEKEQYAGEADPTICMDEWNNFAGKNGLAQITALNTKRRVSIKSRLKEPAFDLKKIFEEIEKSDFCRGSTGQFKVSFDWVFGSPNNYLKILEGNYRNGKSASGNKQSDATARATFKHNEQQIQDLESFGETLRQRYPERG